MYSNPPYSYATINEAYSRFSPSTIHCQNTALVNFFSRYLLEQAMSVYKWTLPENWSENYFLTCLYSLGFVAVVNTDKFGVIPQACTLGGYTVQYQPRFAMITNPLFPRAYKPIIDEECTLFRLRPDYSGLLDIVSYYSDLLALCSETASVNLLNSKMSYVFSADNKADAETLKKIFDQIASGEPAVFYKKRGTGPDTKPWETFSQNVGQNYIVTDILDNLRTIQNQFLTVIGIPNANTSKRERLITAEVESNNQEVNSFAGKMLETLKNCAEKTNKMFGTHITVERRLENDWAANISKRNAVGQAESI